jgi:hypothetical protein
MTNATFNLGSGFFGLDFFSSPTDWAIKTSTASNGLLSDQGPESIYGGVGTCPIPVFFGVNCQSAQSGGSASGTQPFSLFAPGTQIYNGAAVFAAGFRNTGNHALTGGTVTPNAGSAASGLGFENASTPSRWTACWTRPTPRATAAPSCTRTVSAAAPARCASSPSPTRATRPTCSKAT